MDRWGQLYTPCGLTSPGVTLQRVFYFCVRIKSHSDELEENCGYKNNKLQTNDCDKERYTKGNNTCVHLRVLLKE